MPGRHQFTIYDKLEADGYFDGNPANQFSRAKDGRSLYKGPVKFPKMLFHPKGAFKITLPAKAEQTPMGPRMLGEQRELVSAIAEDASELEELKAAGWHDSPAEAAALNPGKLTEAEMDLTANGKDVTTLSSTELALAEAQRENRELQAKLKALKAEEEE